MSYTSGRHFLQIPGPTNVPDRVLRAMDFPTMDHRGPDFAKLTLGILNDLKDVFKTSGHVVVFPGSGTGAWEAAIVNCLSPGDKVLMFETGHFASLWQKMAVHLGIEVECIPGDWHHGVAPELVEEKLKQDSAKQIKAVMVVHNETSTGVTSRIGDIRQAMDGASHPALLMVDTISSLASIDYRMDEWGVDVTVAGSQKGLMLPPGLGFNAMSDYTLERVKESKFPRSYWRWEEMIQNNATGYFPYTPATNLLYGLRESLLMLQEEGLENVFERHQRHAHATRQAVQAWGLEIVCADPREYSNSLTAIELPQGYDADVLRKTILEYFDMSLGTGLGKLAGKVFRIGHLGDFNDLTLAGTLCGVEMGLSMCNVPTQNSGVAAALEYLTGS